MRLSLITDEVGQDAEEGMRLAREHGLEYVAIRSAWGRNVAEFGDEEIARIRRLLDAHGLRVSSVLSPLYKCDPPWQAAPPHDDPHFVGFSTRSADHEALPARLGETARLLGAPVLRLFSFLAPDPPPARAADGLPEEAVAHLERAGAALPEGTVGALENEHVCHVATLAQLERVLHGPPGGRAAGLRATVDLSNHVLAGGDFDVRALTPRLIAATVDVHVKDRRDGRYVPVGSGDFSWEPVLRRLADHGYQGFVTLESHLRGDRAGVRASLDALRKAWPR